MLALLVPGVGMRGGTAVVIYIAGTWFESTRSVNWIESNRGTTWIPTYVSQ